MRHLEYLQHLRNAPDPVEAQMAFERRARVDDLVAHIIAIMLTIGFFILALCALLGFVDLTQPVIATLIGTVLGYAVGQLSPVLGRYFQPRMADPRLDAKFSEAPPAGEPVKKN